MDGASFIDKSSGNLASFTIATNSLAVILANFNVRLGTLVAEEVAGTQHAGGETAASGTLAFRWEFQVPSAVDASDSVTLSCPFGSAAADDTFTLASPLTGEYFIGV